MKTKHQELWRGTLAGLVGGLAGSLVMAQLAGWTKQNVPMLSAASGDTHEDEAHDPKVKLAETWIGQKPSPEVAEASKPLVHYGFGAGMGALYGLGVAWRPALAVGWGLPYGAVVWLAADELGLKFFGLARSSGQPTGAHAMSLGTHLAFGAVTDLLRRRLADSNVA